MSHRSRSSAIERSPVRLGLVRSAWAACRRSAGFGACLGLSSGSAGVPGSGSGTGRLVRRRIAGFDPMSASAGCGGAGPEYISQSGSAARSCRSVKQYWPTRKGTSNGRRHGPPRRRPSSRIGTLGCGRDEAPRLPPALQAADFVGKVVLGQPHFAVCGAADSDRNPGELHDADRARFTILDVEASGFRHRGIDSSLSHTRGGWLHPRSTNKSVPPASQRFQVPPRALAEIATAGSSTVQCTTDHRLKPTAAPIKP